jgi:hypothetical protein
MRALLLLPILLAGAVWAQTRPAPPPSSDEQRAAAFKQTIAYSDALEIEGNQMSVQVDVSWNEAWANTVQVREFKLTGSNLSLISAWAPSPFDPRVIGRGILEWQREP